MTLTCVRRLVGQAFLPVIARNTSRCGKDTADTQEKHFTVGTCRTENQPRLSCGIRPGPGNSGRHGADQRALKGLRTSREAIGCQKVADPRRRRFCGAGIRACNQTIPGAAGVAHKDAEAHAVRAADAAATRKKTAL